MNRGVLHQSSPVQQLMAAGGPSWWNINNNIMMKPSPPPPNNLFPQNAPPPSSSSWHHDNQELPESWSQLLMGGLVAEEDKSSSSSSGLSHIHQQTKKLEIWEDQVDHHVKHDTTPPNISYDHHHHHVYGNINNNAELIQAAAAANPTWPHQMMPVSSPKSCVTSLSSSDILDFSNTKSDGRHPPPDLSSECNNTASTGGAAKKTRVESSSSTQATFKVRKEKLGDRITALHQIVSPFGKTDTASVLFEVIGYIKFLQSQIEALSLPYLGSGSGNNTRQQQSVQGEMNCLFPEDPGQLLNDNCTKGKIAAEQVSHEEAKDLRSRGLCLGPISCTVQVGSETNGTDYWAPAAL